MKESNFGKILDDYEIEHGEIPGLYRDPRGSIYHPHLRETIALGTQAVEAYQRPPWTYGRVVYVEKEGFLEILKVDGWAERHDIMPASSKGYTTRAIKDLIDLLAESDEPVQIFCVHDADAAGTRIYETLVNETKARPARRIDVIDLGLQPWDATAMGLEIETVSYETRQPVANYVLREPSLSPDGTPWADWLQTHRIELNAMTSPQFVAWLDREMAKHPGGKVIPPEEVVIERYKQTLEKAVRERETERILREAGLDQVISKALRSFKIPDGAALLQDMRTHFEVAPEDLWTAHIDAVARGTVQRKR